MGDEWSDEELEICVRQYWKACKNGGQSHAIDRSAFVIMEMHGKPYVIGWKPLPNVGANMTPKIEKMMAALGLI